MDDRPSSNDDVTKPKKSRSIRRMSIEFVVLLALLGVVVFLILRFQNRSIYFPYRYDAALKPGEGQLEDFTLYTTADGREQWGFLIEPAETADDTSGPNPRFYLVFGGNASTAMDQADFYEELAERTGCGFFIVDYRGYGFNEGRPGEKGIRDDAVGAYDTMKAAGRFDRGVGAIGQSLGGGATFALAVERRLDEIIVFSTFTSIDAMARRLVHWPIYLMTTEHYPNDERLAELLGRPTEERPKSITLFHGRRDEIIPFDMGEQLAATPGEGLRFVVHDEANHQNIQDLAFEELIQVLRGSGAQ